MNARHAAPALALVLALSAPAAQAARYWQTLDAIADPRPAPEFSLPDPEGKLHRLSDFRGKTVLVNFWATWCEPCRDEIPSLHKVLDKLGDRGLVVLAVDVGEEPGAVLGFAQQYAIRFPVLLDKESSVSPQWGVRGLPTTYVVDPAGRLTHSAVGVREWDHPEMLEQLQALLKAR